MTDRHFAYRKKPAEPMKWMVYFCCISSYLIAIIRKANLQCGPASNYPRTGKLAHEMDVYCLVLKCHCTARPLQGHHTNCHYNNITRQIHNHFLATSWPISLETLAGQLPILFTNGN